MNRFICLSSKDWIYYNRRSIPSLTPMKSEIIMLVSLDIFLARTILLSALTSPFAFSESYLLACEMLNIFTSIIATLISGFVAKQLHQKKELPKTFLIYLFFLKQIWEIGFMSHEILFELKQINLSFWCSFKEPSGIQKYKHAEGTGTDMKPQVPMVWLLLL